VYGKFNAKGRFLRQTMPMTAAFATWHFCQAVFAHFAHLAQLLWPAAASLANGPDLHDFILL
jgi:hypothetical protein